MNENLKNLYNTLVSNGYNPPAFDQFAKDMQDEKNLRGVYSTLQKEGYTPPAFDTFKSDMGIASAPSSSSTTKHNTLVSPTAKPLGGGIASFVKNSGAAEAAEGVNADAPSYSDPHAVSSWLANIRGQAAHGTRSFNERSANLLEHAKKNPLGRNTVKSGFKYNKKTGDFEQTYLTPYGTRHTDKAEADEVSRQWRDANDHSIEKQIGEAYREQERLEREIEARGKEIEQGESAVGRAIRRGVSGVIAGSLGGAVGKIVDYIANPSDYIYKRTDETYNQLVAASNANKERIKTLEAARDKGGFWRSAINATIDPNTWLFGIPGLVDAATLYTTSKKLEKNGGDASKLTEAEKSMLDNVIANSNVQGEYGDDLGFMYRAGAVTASALPFVAEFAVTGGFSGLANAGARIGEKLAAKAATKGITGKASQWLIKNTGVVAGDVASSLAMAQTTGAARTASNILDRHMGDATIDEQGNYTFKGGEDIATAAAKGVVSSTLEYYTEKLGGHLQLGKWLSKGAEKVGLSKLSKAINYISSNKWLEKGGVQDYPSEVLEEEANIVLNALLVGDNKFSDLWDAKTQADIWGGMAFSLGFMNAPKYANTGYQAAQYYRYKHKTDKSDAAASRQIGADEWQELKEKIDGADNERISDILNSEIIGNDDLSTESRKAAMDYAKNLLEMRGYNMGLLNSVKDDISDKEEDGDKVVDTSVGSSYSEGYNAADETEAATFETEYAAAKAKADETFDEETLALLDDNPVYTLSALRSSEEFTDEALAIAVDYANAKAARDGSEQRMADDLDSEIDAARGEVTQRINGDDFMIHGAQMKADNADGTPKRVHIISGNVSMREDGSVDATKSSQTIVVRDAATGKVEMVSPEHIRSVEEAIDPQEEYSNAEAAARAVYEEKKARIQASAEAEEETEEEDAAEEDDKTDKPDIPVETEVSVGTGVQGSNASALSRVPIDEQSGEPMFERADRETALDALMEMTGGSEDNTREVVNAQLSQARKALEDLKKKQPVKKATTLKGSPMQMIKAQQKAEEDYNAEMASHAQQVAAAEESVNAWTGIYTLMNERGREAREKAEAERKEREAAANAAAAAQAQTEYEARKKAEEERKAIGNENPMPAITEKWENAAKIEGSSDEIVLPNSETVKGHYVLHESGAASASHNPSTWEKTEGFPMDANDNSVNDRDYEQDKDAQRVTLDIANNYDQRAIQTPIVVSSDGVVLSGNGRTMAGELAAQNNTDGAYIAYLQEHAGKYGFTKEQVMEMQHPRVSFVPDVKMPYTAETFAKFNQQEMKSQNKTEQAVKLGKTVSDSIFKKIVKTIMGFDTLGEFYADPEASLGAVYDLYNSGVIPKTQLAEMVDGARGNERLSAIGREMLENMLIGKAFGGYPDAVRMLTEVPSMRQSVITALGEISDNIALGGGYSLSDALADAVKLCYDARRGGAKFGEAVSPYSRIGLLFADPDQLQTVADFNNATMLMLADVLNDSRVTMLKTTLQIYNDSARKSAAGQGDLFAGGIKSKEDTLKDVINFINNNYGRNKKIEEARAAALERRKEEGIQQDGAGEAGSGGSENTGGGERSSEEAASLTHDEAIELIAKMEERAEIAQDVALTIENWDKLFAGGKVYTPLGEVKMGENQFTKLMRQGRNGKLGMVKPTLENPDVVIEDTSDAKEGDVAERGSSYVFIKAFKKADGSRFYYFTSVTVSKDGKEVVISNQEKRKNAIAHLLSNGKLVWKHADDVSAASDVEQGLYSPQGEMSDPATEGTDAPQTNIVSAGKVTEKENSVQTSITNAEQETETDPSEAQKKAGNYKKGHVKIDGFDVTIENPKGSMRRGTDADGKQWEQEMHNTYGYILGTEGVDGDHIDVFLSDNPANGDVFVVDQVNKDGTFDEHKVMYGFASEEEARNAYLSNYEDGWTGLGAITRVSKEEFKKWVDSSHRKTKPFAEYKGVKKTEATDNAEASNSTRSAFDNLKKQASDRMLIFKEGGNYEILYEDAKKSAEILELPVQKKDGKTFVSFPINDLDKNLPLLIRGGVMVAITDELVKTKNQKAGKTEVSGRTEVPGNNTGNTAVGVKGSMLSEEESARLSELRARDRKSLERRELEEMLTLERKDRILRDGTYYDKPFGLKPAGEISSAEDIEENIAKIVKGLKANEGDGRFKDFGGFAYGGNYAKNAGRQIDEYLQALIDVIPSDITKAWCESHGLETHDDVYSYGEKLYNSEKADGTEESAGKNDGNATTDNQGNPLNEDGTLKLEKIASVDELTDEDFSKPTRNVELPALPKNVNDAIGANGKPVIIKKNIFVRNSERHTDLSADDSRNILKAALYNPNLYGQNQKAKRPYSWVVINTKDKEGKNRLVLIELSPEKENAEIVHWYYLRDESLETIKRQAEREGGHILILPSESSEEAGGLSSRTPDLSSDGKVRNNPVISQRNGVRNGGVDELVSDATSIDVEDVASFPKEIREEDVISKEQNGGKRRNGIKVKAGLSGNDLYIQYREGRSSKDKRYWATIKIPNATNHSAGQIIYRLGYLGTFTDIERLAGDAVLELFNKNGLRLQKGEAKEVSPREAAMRDALVDVMRGAGVEVVTDAEEGQRVLDAANGGMRLQAKKRALETASLSEGAERSLTVVSSTAGAKVLNNLDNLTALLENSATQPKTFVGSVAKELGAQRHNSKSEYATFETKNGRVVTIRLADHNATVSNFDQRGKLDGISIVISPKPNGGITNDGNAHITEYYYDAIKLRRADGKPLADIVRSIKQALYSGEFKDATGIAEVQEVNVPNVRVKLNKRSSTEAERIGKETQLDIINKTNPAPDDYHTWVRTTDDILTLQEAVNEVLGEDPSYELSSYPDVSDDVIRDALKSGKITVYSSYPIANGVFVTPSMMQAADYAGGMKVYSKVVSISDVAWLSTDEGQYATTKEDAGSEENEIRYFRTADGHAYGFTVGGKIFIDQRIAGADTPIHEYTHLWAEAFRNANPKEWENIAGLMKGSPLWEEVKKKYPELTTDSEIADEVLAHYSGKRGAERLRKAQEEALKNGNGILEKTAAVAAINNVRTALKRFWKGVADFFGVHFNSAEEVADKVLSDMLNGAKPEVTGKTDAALAKEEAEIIAKAKADGTYLKAPNGKPTNLTPRQWVQVRTKAFKKWFGDWEKRARIEKLRKSESASITGEEIEITDDYKQNKKNALEYGKRLQGEYTNADTGVSVQLQRGRHNGGIKEVLQHNYKDAAHILSVAAIPQIIEKSVYIESEANNDTAKNPDVVEYQHFVCGLKIGNEDYTVHSLVAVDKHGNRYYDHNLTHIEKTKLLDSIERQAVKGQGFDTTSSTELTTLNGYKGKKLLEILQTNSSKVVDENGEPLVVYHGTTTPDITTFDLAKTRSGSAFWFANTEAHKGVFYSNQNDENLIMMPLFINMRTPLLNDADSMESYATDETHDGGLILGKVKDLGFSEEEYQELLDKGLNDNSYLAAGNVTNPNQIKSATDNIGSFSSNPDIRYQFVGENSAGSNAETDIPGDTEELARDGRGAYTDDKVSMENDPWSKMAGYNIRSKKERMAFAERERRRMVDKITDMAERLGIADDVEIVTDLSGLQGRQRRAKGIYRKSSGKITIYIPNHINVADAVATFLHEAVAHKGLRNLFGKHFDEFLDKVYANSNSEIRSAVDALARKKKLSTRTATEEYLAGLAEKTDFEHLPYNGWLQRVKTFFIEMLSKIGIKALDTTTLTDNELRFILWRSYRYMAGKDKGIIAFVEDTAMKMKLGVGYSDKVIAEGAAEANEEEDTFGTDVPREVEEVNRRFNERLSKLVANPNQKDRVLHLGNASGFLRAGGLLDAEILLEFDKLLRKSRSNYKNNHPFDISDAKNLPLAIHNPIAIFDNTNGKEAGRVILTELKKNGRNFIVVVQAKEQRRKGGVLLEINEISTLYPKEAKGVIKWLIDGNATNIDKNKALRFIEELQPLAGTTIKSEELVSAAKIIENFENPKAKALDYLHHSDRNISEALRNPKLVSAAKIVENFENQKIEGENSEEEELYRDDEETEETEETEEVDGGSQSDTKQLRDILIYGNLSFAERTTAAMLLYSNLQNWDKKRKADAVKAIGENIADLAKVMRLQRDFDKATVKRVHDLACVLMESGYLSDLKEQEIKRLLAAVKNSVGKEDIDASVQKVMDIMIDNMLRRGKAALSAIESVRGSKTDTRGVEVQGMLGVDGQTIVKAFKEAKKIVNPCAGKTEGENGENTAWGAAFESVYSRMDSKDQAVADEASLEYAGMQMAQQWYEEIAKSKLEESEIRLELKEEHDKKSAEERRTDSYREFAASMEEAIRQNKIERAQAYFNLAGRLSDSLRGSVENALEFNEAEKRRIGEIHHAANSDMQGRSAKEHQMPSGTRKALNNLLGNYLFTPLATYMEMLRLFGAKSVNGEGYLFNLFGRGWIDARQKEIRGVRGKLELLDAKAKEVFGGKVKTWGDLIRAVGKLPKGKVSFFNGGEMQETELPQGNLMYIYMVNKMLDGKMKLRKMGISEEDASLIEAAIDPRLTEIADWLQEDFLVKARNEYNKTHKRMFGASMAAVENYFPLRILNNALDVKADELDQPKVTDGISTITGSIIKRRRNSKPLDILNADALHVILGHVSQMEHWNAYAEFNRDLNTLRSYRRFRNQVQNMETIYGNGKNLWNKFNDVCQMAAGVYKPKGDEAEKAALAVAQGVTAAAVSFRLYTALKQFASLPAFIPYTRAYYLAKAMMRPDKSWEWCMENLPIFEERWKSRVSGDPRLVKSFLTAADWRRNLAANCARAGMAPNAFIDALTCSMGAYAVYNTRKKQYLKDGYSEEQAERKAIQDAEMVYNETQQSGEDAFTSTMQRDRTWWKSLFTIFRNSSMAYQRQLHGALRDFGNVMSGGVDERVAFVTKQLLREKGIQPNENGEWSEADYKREEAIAKRKVRRQFVKDGLSVATFGYIMQLAWNISGYLPYLLFGDDDETKDEFWDDIWTHTFGGWLEGFTGGDVMSLAIGMLLNGEYDSWKLKKEMPVTSATYDAIGHLLKGDFGAFVSNSTNLLIQMSTGVNPQSLTDGALAIMDACGGDPALANEAVICVSRILSVPQSQIDELYFDELGLRGDEVSKYTPAQLAERYALYKVKRGRFFAPWSWDDEELIEKQEEKANTAIKERLGHAGFTEVTEAYERYEKIAKEIGEQVNALKKADGDGSIKQDEGKKRMDAIKQDRNFNTYALFTNLDKVLEAMSKRYMAAKSPEEAAMYAEAVERYRLAMLDALSADNYAELIEAISRAREINVRTQEEWRNKYKK